jgi:hypothetical protein
VDVLGGHSKLSSNLENPQLSHYIDVKVEESADFEVSLAPKMPDRNPLKILDL